MSDELASRILAELAVIRGMLSNTSPMEDRSLTTAQAAQYLGMHAKTLAKLRSAGEIHGYRPGNSGHWRFRVTELDRYRKSLTTPPPRVGSTTKEIDWGASLSDIRKTTANGPKSTRR